MFGSWFASIRDHEVRIDRVSLIWPACDRFRLCGSSFRGGCLIVLYSCDRFCWYVPTIGTTCARSAGGDFNHRDRPKTDPPITRSDDIGSAVFRARLWAVFRAVWLNTDPALFWCRLVVVFRLVWGRDLPMMRVGNEPKTTTIGSGLAGSTYSDQRL